MNVDKELTESTQTDKDLIETSVKKELECLYISSEDNMTEESDYRMNNKSRTKDNILSFYSIQDRNQSNLQLNICDQNSLISTSIVTTNKFKSETSLSPVIHDNDVSNEVSIEDQVPSSGSSVEESLESNTCELSESEITYVNAVLNQTLGKPLANCYPLKYRWQLWFWRADHGAKLVWEEALQQVSKPFHTIQQFWCLYHHIISVQQLVPPSDYCVFKEGIRPMWEDINNMNGGKWILEFAKGPDRQSNPHLDGIWLEVLLCLIGEGFNDFGEEICGAVVNIRSKEDRISVWTANAHKSVANLKMGEILKMRTGYEGKLKYEAHSTSQKIAQAKKCLVKPKRFIAAKPTRRSSIFLN